MTAVRAALSERVLRRALLAFLGFNILEEAVWLGLLLYAHTVGGATAVGAVAVAQLIPATLLAPVTATWLDRHSVRAGLVLAYGATAATTLVVAVLLLAQASVVPVVVAAVVQSAAVTMGRPAHYSALPRLAELPSHLVAANAATGTVESLGVLLGPLTVTAALVLWDVAPLFVVLSLLLALGAALVATAPVGARGTTGEEGQSPEPFLRAATEGVREVRRIPGAFALLVIIGLVWVLQGALDVLGVSFAIDVLEAGEEGASVIAAGNGVGLLIGSLAAVALVGVARLSRVVVGGAVVGGVAMAAVGLVDLLVLALVLVALSAVARQFVDIAGRTLLHRNANERSMARVFGIQEAVLTGGMAIGATLAPIAIALAGDRVAFALTGVVLALPALLALPQLRALDRSGVVAAEQISLLGRLSLFAPLPPPDLERLALSSGRHDAVDGEVLIEQGDVGDRFYAVHSGSYRVDKDGEPVAVLGPGDFFGEIALLRDVPRTASVICISDGDVLVLDREPFLTAMSRTRPAASDG